MAFEALDGEYDGEESQYLEESVIDSDAVGLDLSNERLLGIDMQGADLSHANLTNSFISVANFKGANLANANLIGATLAGVNLQGADFSGADLSDSKWISVDIEGATFGETVTAGTKSIGVKWSSSNVPPDDKPGPMVTPLIFMPLIIVGGVILSLFLRWRYRKHR